MAMEQYLTHSSVHNLPKEDDDTRECKPSSISTDKNQSGGFDCNICLDTVQDPVVTICGHLYCWPCIYKWIHQPSISLEIPSDHQPQCPVCKAEVSERTLIPLYGRGQSVAESDEDATNLGSIVPHRPNGPPYMLATSATMNQHDAHYRYTSAPAISLSGSMTYHPMISMFGEMISTRFSGSSQSLYPYPNNSYGVAAMASARSRRNVMQADQSLSRLSFFLCCCLILCLVFF